VLGDLLVKILCAALGVEPVLGMAFGPLVKNLIELVGALLKLLDPLAHLGQGARKLID